MHTQKAQAHMQPHTGTDIQTDRYVHDYLPCSLTTHSLLGCTYGSSKVSYSDYKHTMQKRSVHGKLEAMQVHYTHCIQSEISLIKLVVAMHGRT